MSIERKFFQHEAIGKCEICGRIDSCEVHHKKPLSLGGTNEIDNLIFLCEDCHKEQHKSNRSEMVKAGMRNPDSKRELVIGYYELYAEIMQLLIEKANPTILDVLDILNSIPVRRNARKDGTKYFKRFKELQETYADEVRKEVIE